MFRIIMLAILAFATTAPALSQGALPTPASREPKSGEDAVKVSVAVVGDAKPGAMMRIVATLDIAPSWHIYWENPGESGAPTQLEVDLPDGCVITRRADGKPVIDFPVPSVFTHGEVAFGYERSVTISIEVKLPATIPAAGLPTTVRSNWLVCKERCLMGRGESKIDLSKPVGAGTKPVQALADSLAHLPKPLPAEWKVSVSDVGPVKATLVVEAPAAISADAQWQLIPSDTPGVLLESGYMAEAKGRILRVPLALSRESALGRPIEAKGLFILGKNGPAYAFSIPIPAK